MEKVIQSRIYIAFIPFIRPTLKFSRRCLENLLDYCLGHIMQHYYRLKMRKPVPGMRKKPRNRPGVFAPCSVTFHLSIICFRGKAAKYKLYLPTEEELKAELETQKAMFYLKQQDNEEKETE